MFYSLRVATNFLSFMASSFAAVVPNTYGLDVVTLSLQRPHHHDHSKVEIFAFGAHVVSWNAIISGVSNEFLFLSSKSLLDGTKAIRGGVPICWPQFGGRGKLQQHGFARNKTWKYIGASNGVRQDPKGNISWSKALLSLDEKVDMWPYAYKLVYEVMLEWAEDANYPSLLLNLVVENVSDAAFDFTGALHAYFAVPSIESVSIFPLEDREILDHLTGATSKSADKTLTFSGEVDRVYFKALSQPLTIATPQKSFLLTTEGFVDAVTWNPWISKSEKMADMEVDGWKRFVCGMLWILIFANKSNLELWILFLFNPVNRGVAHCAFKLSIHQLPFLLPCKLGIHSTFFSQLQIPIPVFYF